MLQNWVEFKTVEEVERCKAVCLRPGYILAIQDRANKGTRLTYDCNSEVGNIDVNEPYEQVKQKIMDAEKVNLSNVVVEHFTKDEYEKILAVMNVELKECLKDNADVQRTQEIVDKLNEILKEDE